MEPTERSLQIFRSLIPLYLQFSILCSPATLVIGIKLEATERLSHTLKVRQSPLSKTSVNTIKSNLLLHRAPIESVRLDIPITANNAPIHQLTLARHSRLSDHRAGYQRSNALRHHATKAEWFGKDGPVTARL